MWSHILDTCEYILFIFIISSINCSRGQPDIEQTSAYSVDVGYHPSNGHVDNHSPASSHLGIDSLVSHVQKSQTIQQVRYFIITIFVQWIWW